MDLDSDEQPLIEIKPCSKEDNYPIWMREFLQKKKQFSDNLDMAQSQISQIKQGLKEFDEKKSKFEYEQSQYKKPIYTKPKNVNYLELHQQHNEKLISHKLSAFTIANIIVFLPDPVQSTLRMSRVCRKWNKLCYEDYTWFAIIKQVFGMEMTKVVESVEDRKQLCIYFYKDKCSEYLDSSAIELLTKSSIVGCIQSLKLIQQVISIPWNCKIKEDFLKYCQQSDFKCVLDQLINSNYDFIKRQAQACYVSLQNLCYYPYKRIKQMDPLLALKKRLNEEYKNIILPASVYYYIISEDKKVNIQLRNYDKDMQRILSLFKVTNQTQMTIYSYNSPIDLIVTINVLQNRIDGYGIYENEAVVLDGQLQLGEKKKKIFSAYDHGVEFYTNGKLSISLGEMRFQFELYICQDYMGDLHLIGDNEREWVIFKFI